MSQLKELPARKSHGVWGRAERGVVSREKKVKRAVVRYIIYVFLSLMVSILASCSGKVSYQQPADYEPRPVVDLSDTMETSRVLDQHFDKWAGTPYRDGGMDKRGIDCSGFVQQTYYTLFGISLPRTTKIQAKSGNKIARSELKPTDLVFFKTGFFDKHVGIYKGNGQFMHVSTKRGVSLSYLGEFYWNDHFWQARRIIER